jgi:glycosyltransferase involved in cell wall biosynthesis
MWRVILIFLVAFGGFWFGKTPVKPALKPLANVHPEKDFPISERKSFVIVIYAYNQALWCEKALHSVFEQDYDHYRVILVDDGSTDGTSEKAKQFIVANNQGDKAILIRNETRYGLVASLYRAIDSCLDREIVIPLNGKDWLSSPGVLNRLNLAYQNPDVWVTFGQGIEYPSYEIKDDVQTSYYAALFKQIHLEDLFQQGQFAPAYLPPILDLAGGRIRKLQEPIAFSNSASPVFPDQPLPQVAKYEPLSTFPKTRPPTAADILVFSFDRPLQLYACLESIQRYITGYDNLTVLYRASDAQFAAGYEKVKQAFPTIDFVAQSMSDPKQDFKPNIQKIVFDSPSEFVLFGVDDIIVKDFVDLKFCMAQMQKTGAYGFYLRLGRHIHHCYQLDKTQAVPPSQPLTGGVFAWDLKTGEYDWGFANSLDMTLFKKSELKIPFKELKYKTPNSLELCWTQKYSPKKAIGLYFETSKLVNIPMNVVGHTKNHHMNYLNTEELLTKFNQGLKIDIEPLYKLENKSPHLDYIPEFVIR